VGARTGKEMRFFFDNKEMRFGGADAEELMCRAPWHDSGW
jgi:hypothetical protein